VVTSKVRRSPSLGSGNDGGDDAGKGKDILLRLLHVGRDNSCQTSHQHPALLPLLVVAAVLTCQADVTRHSDM
jgi:hypothetical protein